MSYAVSMGKRKTLVFYIPTDDLQESAFKLSSEALASYRDWTGEGCFRMSIGLESSEAIVNDLARSWMLPRQSFASKLARPLTL